MFRHSQLFFCASGAASAAVNATVPRRRFRRLKLGVGAVCLGLAAFDVSCDRAITRNARMVVNAARVTWAYKFTTPRTMEELSALHDYAATLILDTCMINGGLFTKFGQGLSQMNHVLPPEYQTRLKVLLDSAPTVPFPVVRGIIEGDLGRPLSELFETFDPVPVASASIAQVHRATMRVACPQGTAQVASSSSPLSAPATIVIPVAVKVQKPSIRKQAWFDLLGNRLVCYGLQWMFQIPMVWSADTIEREIGRELDFRCEADNMERAARLFAGRPDIYVPRVIRDHLCERVLVTEWMDAVKLSNEDVVVRTFNIADVLTSVSESFGDMIFHHGFVHADPHPANVFVRRRPRGLTSVPISQAQEGEGEGAAAWQRLVDAKFAAKAPPIEPGHSYTGRDEHQVVLLDWGLAVGESPEFRRDYARLFRAIFVGRVETVKEIIAHWGIGSPELFASIQFQKPVTFDHTNTIEGSGSPSGGAGAPRRFVDGKATPEEVAKFNAQVKANIANLLKDEERIPRELIFVGRALNIVRGLNKTFGAPVNRLAILAKSAEAAVVAAEQREAMAATFAAATNAGVLSTRLPTIDAFVRMFDAWQTHWRFRIAMVLLHAWHSLVRLNMNVRALTSTLTGRVDAVPDAPSLEDLAESAEVQFSRHMYDPSKLYGTPAAASH